MTEGILTALGGVGLFLFGMKIMTEALRAAAGDDLRAVVGRSTTTPLRGAVTGTLATALLQSSSAVTVMTVGFVGAGLMTFPQALGVLYGANIGTTLTGWIINLFGFKLQLGTLAMPVMAVAALIAVLARGRAAQIGKGLSGLCLLFIGLDMMQGGAELARDWLRPEHLPGDNLAGRIQLLLMGVVAVSVLQSSSAGVAIALVLLGSGVVSFGQAAALVIGMTVGTSLTSLLASLGGGRAARQTGVANLIYNTAKGLIAFPLLDLLAPVLQGERLGGDPQTALVLFHTSLSLTGALLFLPLTRPFGELVQRLVPERRAAAVGGLDRALLPDPDAAIDAASRAADGVAEMLFRAIGDALHPHQDLRAMAAAKTQAPEILDALEDWLGRIEVPRDRATLRGRVAALLHLLDHLGRLTERMAERDAVAIIASEPQLQRTARAVGALFRRPGAGADRFARLAALIERRGARYRRLTLLRAHRTDATVPDLFRRTDAMRWLAHVTRHGERIAHYRAEVAG